MGRFFDVIFQPGFFASQEVRTALLVGGVVAVVCGVVGVFTVVRGQSFAGHALADVGTTGGSGALLVGTSPLTGFLVFTLAGAAVMDGIGIRRARGRDLATGVVLGVSLGVSALFLNWDTTVHNSHGAVATVLFGSIFSLSPSTTPLVVIMRYRPIHGTCHRPETPNLRTLLVADTVLRTECRVGPVHTLLLAALLGE